MTIVADGDRTVAGFQPGVVMILHYMAVRARFGIIGQVRSSLGVDKGESADATCNPYCSSDDDSLYGCRPHPKESLAETGVGTRIAELNLQDQSVTVFQSPALCRVWNRWLFRSISSIRLSCNDLRHELC